MSALRVLPPARVGLPLSRRCPLLAQSGHGTTSASPFHWVRLNLYDALFSASGANNEATRLHHACRRLSGRLAAFSTCAAAEPTPAGWRPNGLSRKRLASTELVTLQPDLILSNTTPTTAALLHQTRTSRLAHAW